MRDRFSSQLLQLNNELTKMGALCENAIAMAIKAFLLGELDYINKAYKVETEIDEMEKSIEHLCLKLLLQQQPVASDLRSISAALKMITDLERIGDQAVDIAELTQYTKSINTSGHIKKMTEEAVKMVSSSIDSFVKKDLDLAIEVIHQDDVVDELFSLIKQDITNRIKVGKDNTEAMVDVLMIAKYLERIADHATNIAEWVVFSITGSHVVGKEDFDESDE